MVMEDDLTVGGGHTVKYTDHVSEKCTPETLLTDATEINSILKGK